MKILIKNHESEYVLNEDGEFECTHINSHVECFARHGDHSDDEVTCTCELSDEDRTTIFENHLDDLDG